MLPGRPSFRAVVRLHSGALALPLLILLGVGEASAASITWTFSGQISGVFADPRDEALLTAAGIVSGVPFSGSMTFDPAIADRDPSSTFGTYEAVRGFDLAIGGGVYSVSLGIGTIRVNASSSPRLYFATALGADNVLRILSLTLSFLDSDADVIADDSLLLQPPDLSMLDPHNPSDILAVGFVTGMALEGKVNGGTGLVVSVTGELLEIIPEPGSVLLLGGGLLGLAFLHRRRMGKCS